MMIFVRREEMNLEEKEHVAILSKRLSYSCDVIVINDLTKQI